MTIPGVGPVLGLTWALEVGPVERLGNLSRAISFCGLSSALRESAGKQTRGPISKQRNAHLQTVLMEAAHLAPRWNPLLAEVRGDAANAVIRRVGYIDVAGVVGGDSLGLD